MEEPTNPGYSLHLWSCIQYSFPFLPTGIITLSGQGGGGGGGDGLTQEGQECWLWAGPI